MSASAPIFLGVNFFNETRQVSESNTVERSLNLEDAYASGDENDFYDREPSSRTDQGPRINQNIPFHQPERSYSDSHGGDDFKHQEDFRGNYEETLPVEKEDSMMDRSYGHTHVYHDHIHNHTNEHDHEHKVTSLPW